MNCHDLIRVFAQKEITLALKGESLVCSAPDNTLTDELRSLIKQHKSELISILKTKISNNLLPIQVNANKPSKLPLSQSQLRLWLTAQKDLTTNIYNIPVIYKFTGDLNVSMLEASLNRIIVRQESLRTRFVEEKGIVSQVVEPGVSVTLPLILANYETYQREIHANWNYVFDLGVAPLMRCRLLQVQNSEKTADQEFYLILNFHHIVTDGWSIQSIFLNELMEYYSALSTGREVQLAPLPVQYTDYALWQQSVDIESQKRYWQTTLAGYEDNLSLPTDYMRHRDSGQTGRYYKRRYSAAFTAQFERFNQQQGSTFFMGFLAAFAVLFYRYTDKADLCIGTTVAGRYALELEPLIGFFVNILPLRIQVEETQTVKGFMQDIRQRVLSAFDHQVVSYEQILEGYGPAKDGRKSPLVPIIYRHQNFPKMPEKEPLPGEVRFSSRGWSTEDAAPERDATRCELELSSLDDASGLAIDVEYASDLYTQETIERLLNHHEQILLSMFADTDRLLGAIGLLTQSERQQLADWGRGESVALAEGSLLEDYVVQSHKTPDEVVCHDPDGTKYRYGEIAQQARALASYLREQGIGQGDKVGLYLDRDHRLLVSILGVWGVGAAYVPLDPGYPGDYVAQMLEDAAPRVVLSLSGYAGRLESFHARGEVILLDGPSLVSVLASFPTERFEFVRNRADDLAYLMYTSGSTGRPKAVKVPHRQLNNWCSHIRDHWPFAADDVVAQKTTMAFAVSVKELFAGVVAGCPLVFIGGEHSKDPALLIKAIKRYRITRINLVPSHLSLLLDAVEGASGAEAVSGLRLCTAAGEPLTAGLVMRCRRQLPGLRLLNNYGCTELNDVTYYDTGEFDGSREFVPIGRPIRNTQVSVLDRAKRVVPVGVAGELHVASAGMSLGYEGEAALTAAHYSANPGAEGLLYNTGDVVKYLPDGQLEYLQRWDFQVKVRGHRVDVRQVEKLLGEQAGIAGCAVVLLADQQQLAAYYRVSSPVEESDLRSALSALLPAYMVPDVWQELEAFPRLPNGKLDRRGLMALELSHPQEAAHVALETDTEAQLAQIWSEVLDVPQASLGRQSNFFALGGHSLTAVKVVAMLNSRLGVELLVADLISQPTIEGMASVLESRSTQSHYSYRYSAGDTIYSLPNKQLLFKSTFLHHWNVTHIVNLINPEPYLLEKALRTVLETHQGLRHQFFIEKNRVFERIVDLDDKPILKIIDLSDIEDKKAQSNNIEIISNQLQSTLNLSEVLYKFVLFVCGKDEPARFLWIVHHALVDIYSMNIFIGDLFKCYMSNLQQKSYFLRPATTSLAEWGNYLHQYVNSNNVRKDIDYWTNFPWHKIGMLVDHPEGVVKNKSQDTGLYGKDIVVSRSLDFEYSDLLQSGRWNQSGITTAGIIFAAFTSVISKLTKSEYVFFDILSHGRDNIIPGVDLTRTIGWLAAYVPVVIKVERDLLASEKVQLYVRQFNQIPSSGLSFNALKYLSDDPSIREIFEAMPIAEFNINYVPPAIKELEKNNEGFGRLPIRLWEQSKESAGEDHGARHADIIWPSYIHICYQNDVCVFTWTVRDNVYNKKTIEVAVESWLDEIKTIVDAVRPKASVDMIS